MKIILILLMLSLTGGQPAGLLRDRAQMKTVQSLKDLGEERLYRMDYKADYRLQDFIDADLNSKEAVQGGVAEMLLDPSAWGKMVAGRPSALPGGVQGTLPWQPACSAFQAVTPEGDVIYGRNFDYDFADGASLMVRTRPRGGYRSMSLVSMSHIGMTGAQLADGETDLSMLVAAPYAMMDGVNEKGFCISVLALTGGDCARQYNKEKHSIMTTVLMRLLLDRAATVEEALALCRQYNFFADGEQRRVPWRDKTNYHFLLSDASGRTVVLEYVREDGLKGKGPWVMNVIDARFVTNFYLAEGWREVIRPDDRYGKMKETLSATVPKSSLASGAVMTEAEAMALLQAVSQKPERRGDVRTQWSVVYNLTRRTATVCPAGDYGHPFTFSLRRGWRP